MEAQIRYHLSVGRDAFAAHEYDQAKPHLEAVLETHDGFADVHHMLGVIHHQEGRPGKAREFFERALILNPHYTEAALNLSICYDELGEYDAAAKVYREAIGDRVSGEAGDLDPHVRGKIANMHADIGTAYLSAGATAQAIEEMRKGVDLCPQFTDLRTRLGEALRSQDVEASIKELTTAVEEDPKFQAARIQLGLSLWAAKRFDDARAQWREVLDADPEHRACKVYMNMSAD